MAQYKSKGKEADTNKVAKTHDQILTNKQERFCYEYCIDFNATQAAKRAGYSEQTAYQIGFDNLKKVEIKKRIDEMKANLAETAGISALKVINEHAKIAFTDAGQLRTGWMEMKDFEALTMEQKASIQEVATKIEKRYEAQSNEMIDVVYVKIKMYDKQKSLDSISNILGFNAPTKQEVQATVQTVTGLEVK